MRFDHINISANVSFMEELKDFYCEVLELSVGPRPEIPIPGYWLYHADSDAAIIHMIEGPHHKPPELSHLDHVAFKVEDLQKVHDQLNRRGLDYNYIELPDFGIEQIQFLDPAGIKIEINCYTGREA